MARRRDLRKPKGFTLVELLVVVAVIGLLMALLLPVLGRAQQAARETNCRNNMSQIYKAARLYTTHYSDLLPNLFAGLDFSDHVARYRKSHYTRSTDTEGQEVPAGLWLVKTCGYAESDKVFYCPNVPGRRRFQGSENPTVDDVPLMAGYVYNYFPDTSPDDLPLLEPPGSLSLDEVTNNLNQVRHASFRVLLADLFLNSLEQPHRGRNGINCCYWDGSLHWVTLQGLRIPWNKTEGKAQVFSDDKAGSEAVRDAWVLLSEHRR